MELKVRNVNEAVSRGLLYLIQKGEKSESRNGTVLVAPQPVMTVYRNPLERVLFSPLRDANPFFHLMEALWMLAGRNDVVFPSYFNKQFMEYSDDGETVHGAYGHRWRTNFGYDQLIYIADELKSNPNSRRCVLTMWDASAQDAVRNKADLHKAMSGGKDVPCNTHAYFEVRDGKLNMTVCCRSNDVIWGAYGANAVHFSILQEYMAFWVGAEVGVYRQFSNNYHAYTDVYDTYKLQEISIQAHRTDYYLKGNVKAFPLINTDIKTWNNDLISFFSNPLHQYNYYTDSFFAHIAAPMYYAWYARKEKLNNGIQHINYMPECDWKLACAQWIERREEKKNAA